MSLYQYQRDGVNFLKSRQRAILGDDMGVGKTIQALYAIEELDSFPLLVICPKTVKLSWKIEVHKWLKGRTAVIVDGDKRRRSAQINSKCDVLIMNYEQMKIHEVELLKKEFKSIVFDEAHKLKNHQGKSFRTACHLRSKFKDARIYFLSGTPMRNRPQEIWTMLHLIDKENYNSYWRWIHTNFKWHNENYSGITVKKIDDPIDYDDFRKTLSMFMLRRERDAVLDLPSLNEIEYPIELEDSQRKIYNSMRDNMVAQLESGSLIPAPIVIAQITRLKQICCSPSIIEAPYGCEGTKLDAVVDLIEASQGKKIVIFSQFATYLTEMHKKLQKYGFGLITGETAMERRISLVKDFQDPNSKLKGMLISVKAGGEGITLTEGNVVIFTDLVWTPADIDQAIGRVYRNGQTKPVTVYYIRALNTIESKIDSLIRSKRLTIMRAMPVSEVRDLLT